MGGVLGGFSSPKVFWGDRNIFFPEAGKSRHRKIASYSRKRGVLRVSIELDI